MTAFTFRLSTGGWPRRVIVAPEGQPSFVCAGDKPLVINTAGSRHIYFVAPDGFWERLLFSSQLNGTNVNVVFDPIRPTAAMPWWHELHCRAPQQFNPLPVPPIRIGVIDEGLRVQPSTSNIYHVHNLGGEAYGERRSHRALNPITPHGHSVCALLGARAGGGRGFPGIIPEAEIFFAAAGRDQDEKVSPGRLAAGIDHLVDVCRCDLLSISVGDSPKALQTIQLEVEDAADRGSLCFFSAGNTGRALYPASQPNCLAVAALGKTGVAPYGSRVWHEDRTRADPLAPPYYLWEGSGRGPEIEFCAAGVGVLWTTDTGAGGAAIGSSFACPLAVGAAARLLAQNVKFRQAPRNRARYVDAVQDLASACVPFGSPYEAGYWKYGRLQVS